MLLSLDSDIDTEQQQPCNKIEDIGKGRSLAKEYKTTFKNMKDLNHHLRTHKEKLRRKEEIIRHDVHREKSFNNKIRGMSNAGKVWKDHDKISL